MTDGSALPAPEPTADAPRKRRPRGMKRPYSPTAISSMKRAIRVLGQRTIDRRTATGKWLLERCAEYADALGGEEAISPQQRTIIRLVAFDELVLQSGQAWLMRQDALVSGKRRSFLPIVRELSVLGDSLARKLERLGLERRARNLDLAAELAQLHARRRRDARVAPEV